MADQEAIAETTRELEKETLEAAHEIEKEVEQSTEETEKVVEQLEGEVEEGVTTPAEAAEGVKEAIEEEAEEIADETGHPDQTEVIAERIFQKLEARGAFKFLDEQTHSAPHEAEEVVQHVEETPSEVVEETHADTPPTPQHWWYKPRFGRH